MKVYFTKFAFRFFVLAWLERWNDMGATEMDLFQVALF